MGTTAPTLLVVAGILRRDGAILACRRRMAGAFGGRWELPGGKIEPGETPTRALIRELREELGITARPGAEVERVRHVYAEGAPVEIRFYEIEAFQEEPVNHCFDSIRWVTPVDLGGLDWLDADRPLIRRLSASGGMPLRPRARAAAP